ncbi:MAG: hypothetical protein M3P99_03500 [Pseudomonadota bacterium]|nr:hypothetical protein [Pseudomonadota bacterium]
MILVRPAGIVPRTRFVAFALVTVRDACAFAPGLVLAIESTGTQAIAARMQLPINVETIKRTVSPLSTASTKHLQIRDAQADHS